MKPTVDLQARCIRIHEEAMGNSMTRHHPYREDVKNAGYMDRRSGISAGEGGGK